MVFRDILTIKYELCIKIVNKVFLKELFDGSKLEKGTKLSFNVVNSCLLKIKRKYHQKS